MEEFWKQIEGFDSYSVSNLGRIRNEYRKRIVKPSHTQQGALKVALMSDRRHTLSVKVLVAKAFVEGYSEKFNTPLQLDYNQENCNAENLIWRPRWFAWKYARQVGQEYKYAGQGPIVERKSGLVFTDIVEASTTYGFLYWDVRQSLVGKIPVFPTWQMFDWVTE